MSGADPVLWSPDEDRVDRARITGFRRFINERHGAGLAGQDELHRWSVANPEDFWSAVWDHCGVVGDKGQAPFLVNGQEMPGARWFPGARLNFAENLLHGPDLPAALIHADETGRRRELSLGQLRDQSARLAAALAADGVGPGVRVVGFLPNIPEAVVAMLAVARLGGVWSSCSPDFGEQGVLDRFGQIEPRVLVAADGYHYGGKEHRSLDLVERLIGSLPGLQRTVVVGNLEGGEEGPALPAGAVSWNDYLAAPGTPAPPFQRLPFDHPLYIMFSSGTTGLPKCMVHSAGGTLLQHLKEHQLHCDVGEGDRLFYFTTCGWMMWNWLVSGLASGAAVVLYDGHPLLPESALWDLAQREGVTVMGTSARHIAACAKAGLQPARTHDLTALRSVLSTGSPLLPESFDYVYEHVKSDLQLSSISGGTDIISCFALGSPVLPVRRGELQCRGLGMAVAVYDDQGRPVTGRKGELVCTAPFPSMPTGFWNDPGGRRYHAAYFDRFDGVWCHGDFAELTGSGGMIIHGRSDTVLNPGGVRIGTAEIYRVVEKFPEVRECLAVGQPWQGDVRIVLFVLLQEGVAWSPDLEGAIKVRLRREKSPRHVPAAVVPAPDLPRTLSGKLVEKAVTRILAGQAVDNADALANPVALDFFRKWVEGSSGDQSGDLSAGEESSG